MLLLLALIFPYLQNPQPTSMTIMWPSTNAQQTGWVEYGIDSLNHVAREWHDGLYAAYQDVNQVTLTGLQPATTYCYRVAALDIVGEVHRNSLTYGDTTYSPVYQFTTPAEKSETVSCLIFNDLHDGDSLMAPLLRNNAVDIHQYDFAFFNGDVFQSVPSREHVIRHMLAPYSELFANRLPVLYTRGNHEYRHKFARELARYVSTPGSQQGHPYYYTFTWGPCFFIVLDAGEDKPNNSPSYCGLVESDRYRAEETIWLEQQLQSAACRAATYRVVLMHAPFVTNTNMDQSISEARRLFLPLCNRYGVDLAISGHTHRAAVFPANDEHHFPIVLGGGKRLLPEEPDRYPTVIQLQANNEQLNVQIWNYYHESKGTVTLQAQPTHRLATYNVRYVNRDLAKRDKGKRSWYERRAYVIRNVIDNHLDIVGMQEVTGNNRDSVTGKSQLQDLQEGLKDYTCIAYEREDSNYSYNCVFYRTDKYECLHHESFWLSETPEVASKGWGSNYFRRCIVALMRDKATGKQFYFCCAHTDFTPIEVGVHQAELLGQRLSTLSTLHTTPLVLVGDLNFAKKFYPDIYAIYAKYFMDSSDSDFPTFQHWTSVNSMDFTGREIDYLFYLNMLPRRRQIVTEDFGRGISPSDHFPVYVDFQLK